MTPQTPKNTKNSISFSFFEVKQIIHQETCSRKQNDDKQSYAEQQVRIDIKFHHPGKHNTSENQFRDIQTIITELFGKLFFPFYINPFHTSKDKRFRPSAQE